MARLVVSPRPKDPTEVPIISLTDFIFENLKSKLPKISDKPWVVDAMTGKSIMFGELEDKSRRVASALTRIGFKKGDIVNYVTYESAEMYMMQVAVWRIGGALRGSHQFGEPEKYVREINETGARLVLVDAETAPLIKVAIAKLDRPVQLLSVGDELVPDAISFAQLIQDDGTAFPDDVVINPREDIIVIPNTSGSTGVPKGVLHSHYNGVAILYGLRDYLQEDTKLMTLANNFSAANFYGTITTLYSGSTLYCVSKFSYDNFFDQLNKYKPNMINMYPYIATWFARSPGLDKRDLSFIKSIGIGGSVLDPRTAQLLNQRLPHVLLFQIYAQSECTGVAYSIMSKKSMTDFALKTITNHGELCVSSGGLLPYIQAKVIDPETGKMLPPGEKGEILIRSPYIMLGYLRQNQMPDRSSVDEEGFYHTGDLGFYDENGEFYIRERKSFMFKYYMQYVSPSVIESVLQEHLAVEAAGVVGIPHPETTSLARAFVVLRDGCSATCQQLEQHVAARLPSHMHLHGGVQLIKNLPMNSGGKLDRAALLKIAKQDEPIDQI